MRTRIRNLREDNDLTQNELSKYLNISTFHKLLILTMN